METVFLLWHSYEDDTECECEHAFLLGVYPTHAAAASRIQTAKLLPGFRRYPDGFGIDEHRVGADKWEEGFRTEIEGVEIPDPDP